MPLKQYIKRNKQKKWTLKMLGYQIIKKHNCNPFQSSPSLFILWYLLSHLNLLYMFWAPIFTFHPIWWQFRPFEFWHVSWHSSPNPIFQLLSAIAVKVLVVLKPTAICFMVFVSYLALLSNLKFFRDFLKCHFQQMLPTGNKKYIYNLLYYMLIYLIKNWIIG